MASLFTLAAVLALVFFPVRAAFRGEGYRGLYFGAAFCCLVMTFGCFTVIPTERDLTQAVAENNQSLIAGTRLLLLIGPSVALVWMAATFGSILAGLIFRAKPTSEQQH